MSKSFNHCLPGALLSSAKFAPHCGAKAVSKSKSLKHGSVGSLLEVQLRNFFLPHTARRESDFEVKIVKAQQRRALWEVERRKICTTIWGESDFEGKKHQSTRPVAETPETATRNDPCKVTFPRIQHLQPFHGLSVPHLKINVAKHEIPALATQKASFRTLFKSTTYSSVSAPVTNSCACRVYLATCRVCLG